MLNEWWVLAMFVMGHARNSSIREEAPKGEKGSLKKRGREEKKRAGI